MITNSCSNFIASHVWRFPCSIRRKMSHNHKVIFGGESHFYSAYSFTAHELRNHKNILVSQCSAAKFSDRIADVDVIIPFMQRIDSGIIDSAKKLKMIMQFGVGLEGVDINAATAKNVWVCLIPGALCGNAQSCAEHSIYLALSVLRNQKQMQVSLTQGLIGCPTGRTLYGSRILIYGFGGIGQQLAKRLSNFDAEIVAVTRTLPEAGSSVPCQEFVRELGDISAFPRLAASADVVFICCTQNPSTMGLVNESFISHLKDGAVIVNVARGGIFNYPHVLEALNTGKLSGVGIDVYHTEPFPDPATDAFLSHPNVIATPHVAGVTEISYRNMAKIVADNVLKVLAGEKPSGAVNNLS